jgi:GT2 family glycosyltransferase
MPPKESPAEAASAGPLVGRMAERIATMELSRFWKLRNAIFALRKRLGLSPVGAMPPFAIDATERSIIAAGGPYGQWLQQHGTRPSDVARMREIATVLPVRPTISIVMATSDPQPQHLRAALDSVLAQAYPQWELCVADDRSRDPEILAILSAYAARDRRIRVVARETSGHISRASNTALALATGDFAGFLDHDDLLAPDACFEVALCLNRHPDADMIYSDEDKIDDTGALRDPYFKPEWAPDSFLSRMYTGHFAVYRRALLMELGGLRAGFEGSQDYDLVLRLTERTGRIHHIPRVLYHWRAHEGSTAGEAGAKPYAFDAAVRALGEALERRGEPGEVRQVPGAPGVYIVRYRIADPARVSIVIPTRDHGDDLERCLKSLFALTTYPDFEVLLVDNGTTDPHSRAVLERWSAQEPRIRLLRYDVPFNYAKINNWAVAQARGTYLALLNNDTEVLTPDWLEAMVEQAQRPAIGAVGALLLYDDDTIQHAGVIVGINGVAGHSHKHFPRDAPGYFNMLKAVNNYSAVTSAAMMTRKAVYEQVGGMEEELAIAFNDIDYSLRARAAGYRNVWLPHVVLRHAESKSRGRDTTFARRQILYREEAFMKRRWSTDSEPDPYYSPHLTRRTEDYAIRLESEDP